MHIPYPLYSKFVFGDMTVLYLVCHERLILAVVPAGMEEEIPIHRHDLNDTIPYRNNHLATGNSACVLGDESMVQLHLMEDPFPYADTMRNGKSVTRQQLKFQRREENKILTGFADDRGVELLHTVEWNPGERFFTVSTQLTNHSGREIELGMQESAGIGLLSPFHCDEAAGALKLYRYRSAWSAEAREVVNVPEELSLAVVWNGGCSSSLRFGQRSSMVSREWFPMVGLTDTEANVSWGIQLATLQPWQMCLSRRGDFLSLSGGPADFDFANFRCTLADGGSFSAFPAVISCVRGDVTDLRNRLTDFPVKRALFPRPEAEKDLPLIFNEFCTTWGCPTEDRLLPVIERVKALGCRYFVIDGGWGRDDRTKRPGIGDWIPFPGIYPSGFDFLLDKIREAGMIPGIWFEFECSSGDCELYRRHPDWFIRFEGKEYLLNIDRHVLDFRKPEVIAYLDEHVIGFLKKHKFGYMKVDYNTKFHLADTPHGSGAAGAAEVLAAIGEFFRKIRRELPELVLEICSSGGMRLTPGWMQLANMASFSDSHEGLAIPMIAADVSLQIPFRYNQVWCVLRAGDSETLTMFRLAAGFLGRLCVSGDGDRFSDFQCEAVKRTGKLYQEAADILENGESRIERHLTTVAYDGPKGYQFYRRTAASGEVVVLHTFAGCGKSQELPVKFRRIAGSLAAPGVKIELFDGKLVFSGMGELDGAAVLLR